MPSTSPFALRPTVAGLVAMALFLAACGGEDDKTSDKPPPKGARTVKVTLTDAGCDPARLEVRSGPTTFDVTNVEAKAVSELEVIKETNVLGEVYVSPGENGSFSATLQPGDYKLSCPGGRGASEGVLHVTGPRVAKAASATQKAAVSNYRSFLKQQTARLVERTQAFTKAVEDGDVATAKELYGPARVPYERIEPVAESFGNLDPKIDARAGDVPRSEWTGFHPLEQALWVKESVKGKEKLAALLLDDVRDLQRKVKTVKLEPAQIANGAVELLGEVSKSKITGEEERYSRIDLVDFEANVEGAKSAFDAVTPLVLERDKALASRINRHFKAVDAALEQHRRGNGFVPYDELTRPEIRRLSQAIDALAEPLSQVPGLIVT